MENTITDEQVSKLYNHLDKEETNSKKEKLEEASKETENTNYNNIEKMKTKNLGVPIDDKYLDIFSEYDINTEESRVLLSLIIEYKNDRNTKNIYDRLPAKVQLYVDNLRLSSPQKVKVSKENTAKFLLDSFINDIEFTDTIEQYNKEMNDLMLESNKEFQLIVQESTDNLFNNIDKLKETNPEKADELEAMKQAFIDSKTFNLQVEYLDNANIKKLKKLSKRFNSECIYFNKSVNKTDIKIPDIRRIVPIINKALPEYSEDTIKIFAVVIIKSVSKYNVEENINQLAYIYKLINNIIIYEFADSFDGDENYKELFSNINKVLEKINTKLNEFGG